MMMRLLPAYAVLLASLLFFPAVAHSSDVKCALREAVLIALANRGERLSEHGRDGETSAFVGITLSRTLRWSLVVGPPGQGRLLCLVSNGTQWAQTEGSSQGVLHDGVSSFTVTFDKDGDWKMLHKRGVGGDFWPAVAVSGSRWRRVIPGEKWHASL